MTTIKALGVVDYHTFPREHFEINGNVLVFEAENGTGKTAIMTALFPTIFTMDFLTALNQGGQQNRKPKDFLKDTGTYIYGMFNSDEGPYTLVIHGQRRGDSVDIKATKLDTHDVTFTDELDQPLPWNTFKNKHKEFMNTKIFHTQKEYQTWVAKEIFGIAPNRFKAYIRLLCQLSNPKIMTSENTNIEQIKEQLKNGLATISDNDDLFDILSNYATQLQKATLEKQKLIELKSQFNSALDRRNTVAKKNLDTISKIQTKFVEMNKHVSKLEQQYEDENTALNKLYTTHDQIQEQLKQAGQEAKDVEAQIQEIERKLRQYSRKSEQELTDEIKSVQTKLQQAVSSYAEKQVQLTNASAKLTETERTVNALRISLTEYAYLPQPDVPWSVIETQLNEQRLNNKEREKLEYQLQLNKEEVSTLNKTEASLQESISEESLLLINQYEDLFKTLNILQPVELNTISDLIGSLKYNQEITKHQLETDLKNLQLELRTYQNTLHALQQSTEPQVSYVASNAEPLFKVIDFKDSVDESTRAKIESYLREAGFLELIVSADSVDKGVYLS